MGICHVLFQPWMQSNFIRFNKDKTECFWNRKWGVNWRREVRNLRAESPNPSPRDLPPAKHYFDNLFGRRISCDLYSFSTWTAEQLWGWLRWSAELQLETRLSSSGSCSLCDFMMSHVKLVQRTGSQKTLFICLCCLHRVSFTRRPPLDICVYIFSQNNQSSPVFSLMCWHFSTYHH